MGGLSCDDGHFYPRSPCGERHLRVVDGSKSSIISIHALLAESDQKKKNQPGKSNISIHALLAESDGLSDSDRRNICNFYPRSPCGERHPCGGVKVIRNGISIHALLAESDKPCTRLSGRNTISIHALLAESDKLILA